MNPTAAWHLRRPLTSLVALALVAVAAPAFATVLTFDHSGANFESLETLHTPYGDRVTATSMLDPNTYTYGYGSASGFTPNVVVDYSHNSPNQGHIIHQAAAYWTDPVDYLHYFDGYQYWITFTPDAGYGVTLESFITDVYTGGPYTFSWVVRQDHTGGGVVASGSTNVLAYDTEVPFSPGVSYAGPLVLEMTFSNTGNGGVIGVDDVTFSQYLVPEPASAALLALGGAAMLRRRRR